MVRMRGTRILYMTLDEASLFQEGMLEVAVLDNDEEEDVD